MFVSFMFLNNAVENLVGQKLSQLSENVFALIHGMLLSQSKIPSFNSNRSQLKKRYKCD